jgi:hypothetical protein
MTNSKIISLDQKRKEKIDKVEKSALPSHDVVKLWRMSLAMDDLVKDAVLNDKLPADEVATIFANRLGTLIGCCENPQELSKFCCEIIQRMNTKEETDKGTA